MKLIPVVVSMMVSSSLYAQDISIKGTITHKVKSKINAENRTIALDKFREIKLLKVKFSEKAKSELLAKANDALAHRNQFATNAVTINRKLPSQIQLGMNDVPVLDQGNFGTCVTFATTAAVDAALGKGDYISQLCQLQVGNYLADNGYGLSGWDGSFGRLVLGQMDNFGMVSKAQEEKVGCGDLYQYPSSGSIPTSSISLDDYHQISEPLNTISWSSILDPLQASDRIDTNKTLSEVKSSLVDGERVTFGTILLDFDLGFVGAVGTKNSTYDTWVLTPEIARDVYMRPFFGGHEMVITGYDDDAIAVDEEGRKHQGLLTLRNSWGEQVGDHGDFFMSYDYFKLLVIEAQRIRVLEELDDDVEKS